MNEYVKVRARESEREKAIEFALQSNGISLSYLWCCI